MGSGSLDDDESRLFGGRERDQGDKPTPAAIYTALPPPLVNRLAAGLLAQGRRSERVDGSAMEPRRRAVPRRVQGAGKRHLRVVRLSRVKVRPRTASQGNTEEIRARHRWGASPRSGSKRYACSRAPCARPDPASQRDRAGAARRARLQGVGLADRVYEPKGITTRSVSGHRQGRRESFFRSLPPRRERVDPLKIKGARRARLSVQ